MTAKRSRELPRLGESLQQEMEIDQAGPGSPGRQVTLDRIMPGATSTPQPSPEGVLRPDIVAREDMQPSEPPQEDVLGRPPPHSSQRGECFDRRVVIQVSEALEVEATLGHSASQLDRCSRLRSVETKPSERIDPR